MSDRNFSGSAVAEWLDQLSNEFATTQSPHEEVSEWISSLLHLEELARSSGESEIASMARNLADSLPEVVDPAETAELLGVGLVNLRDALRPEAPQPVPAAPTSLGMNLAQDPELLGDFILESREHLSSIERHLLSLEQNEHDTDAVHAIFRSFHTIKGLAGFLEFALIQEVAHEIESTLDRVRQGEIPVTPAIVDVVLEGRDFIGQWLNYLEAGNGDSVPSALSDPRGLIQRIHTSANGAQQPPQPAVVPPQAGLMQPVEESAEPDAPVRIDEPAIGAASAATAAAPAAEGTPQKGAGARSIKVNTDKLDYLVDMVGEMVIAQSLVRHDPDLANLQNPKLIRNLAQLARITNDVQRTAMSMRMVPIGSLFQKMARLVRDLSRRCGKQIHFETQGEDVELDRNIVEELGDPLMHMVRNAVDHGIEGPEDRVRAGKSPSAQISLRAFHRAGQIVIEVADNGRGINRERVLNKARQKGLVAANAVLSDNEIHNLIFHPGFSTVDNVSDLSGRGVGMDVVRKQISRLRGAIDIHSVEGSGTTFGLRLPLTLAIIDGLVVIVGQERFIIPLASVKELLRPRPEMLSTVENKAEMVLIRDQLLPIVRLHERFGITPQSTEPAECVLVVADADGCSFCLMVDEMAGKQEVVIKSLGSIFQRVAGVAGGAILGDGHVGLILDLKGLFGGRKDV